MHLAHCRTLFDLLGDGWDSDGRRPQWSTQMIRVLFFVLVMSIGRLAIASPEYDNAYAHVAIAKAIFDNGNAAPDLPDKPPQAIGPIAPTPLEETAATGDSHGQASETRSPTDGAGEISAIEAVLDMPPQTIGPIARRYREWSTSVPSMSIIPLREVPKSAIRPRRKVIVYTGEDAYGVGWCTVCNLRKREWGNGDAFTAIEWSTKKADGQQSYPAIRFQDDAGKWWFPSDNGATYHECVTVDEIGHYVNSVIPGAQESYAATGSAGSIQASTQIRATINFFRDRVGAGNIATLVWDRNGDSNLSLMAMKQWNAMMMFGADGRIEIGCPDARNLPMKEFAFGYRIRGSDIIADSDPVVFRGLADSLSISDHAAALAPIPVGLIGIDDALLWYEIVCMMRDIFSILHPSADVILGPQISASAVLRDDAIVVTFSKGLSLRFTWLFSFNLQVKSVTITDNNIHIEFTGSRFVRSRDFAVQ